MLYMYLYYKLVLREISVYIFTAFDLTRHIYIYCNAIVFFIFF